MPRALRAIGTKKPVQTGQMRKKGVEPIHPNREQEPESCASTNFATLALSSLFGQLKTDLLLVKFIFNVKSFLLTFFGGGCLPLRGYCPKVETCHDTRVPGMGNSLEVKVPNPPGSGKDIAEHQGCPSRGGI